MLICGKILRKLEGLNPVIVASAADGLLHKLDELFGEGKMPLCEEKLKRFRSAIR